MKNHRLLTTITATLLTLTPINPAISNTSNNSYPQLSQHLNLQNWKAADIETRKLIQQWTYPNGDLYAEPQFNKIPCENLRTIDTLWMQASNGQFGFTIQQQLWQKQQYTNPRQKVEALGKTAGWMRTKPLTEAELADKFYAANWVMETELNYTTKAPKGHLPWNGISAETINSLTSQIGSGCGSCSIDAMYLQEERNYKYLPGLYERVKTCLAASPSPSNPIEKALTSKNWREANRLTSNKLLELAGKQQQRYLTASDIKKLPCTDLQTIDQLWLQNSNNQFGLSVQAKIWQNIKGKNYQDSLRFEEIVGWDKTQPIFDQKAAPKGHLPLRPALSEGIMDAWGGWWIQEMSNRLKTCKIL